MRSWSLLLLLLVTSFAFGQDIAATRLAQTQLSSALVPIVLKHFTVRELEAQNQFDASEAGQSILKKQLTFENEAKAVLDRELSSAFRELLRSKQSQPK